MAHPWVTPYMHESGHICMSHVIDEWVVLHRDEFCHTWIGHVAYELVVSYMNESCHIWTSHATFEYECPNEWVMSHMNESCRIWMSRVTYEWAISRMNESCHVSVIYEGRHTWWCNMAAATRPTKFESTSTAQQVGERVMLHKNERLAPITSSASLCASRTCFWYTCICTCIYIYIKWENALCYTRTRGSQLSFLPHPYVCLEPVFGIHL